MIASALQWLDYNTYMRLAASLALPTYAIFSLVCISSYAVVLITRWKGTKQVTGIEGPAKYVRSSSRAQLYQKKIEKENEEKFKLDKTSSIQKFLREMSSRSDLCFHIGNCIL